MVDGKTSQAGDVLVQRFKSLLMALRGGTDTAAKWIELLPNDVMASMASTGEDFLAWLCTKPAAMSCFAKLRPLPRDSEGEGPRRPGPPLSSTKVHKEREP